MVIQTRPRFILAVLGSVVVASTLSCVVGSKPRKVTRLGDDVIMAGSMVYLAERDSVPGDAILSGRSVEFHSAIGGDYLGASGMQTIGGRIRGSVRAVGGEIHVTGAIDRNATIAGGSVTLDSTADITRNAYVIGGNVSIAGNVHGSLLASGGSVTLNGTVGRDVEVSGGSLTVGPHAVITGNLRYHVPAEKVHIDSAARISGTVTAIPVSGRWGLNRWLWMLGFLVAGGVVVALIPRFVAEAAEIIPLSPFRSALVGLGWFILVPVAVIIAAITVIGLPLALMTAFLYGVLVYLSSVPFALWVGRRLLGARTGAGRRGALFNFLIGGFLLLLVGIIPVIGGVVTLIAACLGLGAIMLRTLALRRETQPV
jgi:cytoskeletal protein CcmA (bactofilin family)